MNVDTQGGVPTYNGGRGPTCHECGQTGHKRDKCPKKQNAPAGSETNRPACEFCQKTNHTSDKCFKNPNRQPIEKSNSNGPSNPSQNGQKRSEISGFAGEGYIFKDRVPEYTGSEKYCPICNRCDHFQHECINLEAVSSLMLSKICCWRCCYRGHTASDCRNPQPQCCSTCRKTGHKAEDCRDKIQAVFQAPMQESAKRFIWRDTNDFLIKPAFGQLEQAELQQEIQDRTNEGDFMDIMDYTAAIEEIAKEQIIEWKGQRQPLHHISLLNDLTKVAWSGHYPQRCNTRPILKQPGFKVHKTNSSKTKPTISNPSNIEKTASHPNNVRSAKKSTAPAGSTASKTTAPPSRSAAQKSWNVEFSLMPQPGSSTATLRRESSSGAILKPWRPW